MLPNLSSLAISALADPALLSDEDLDNELARCELLNREKAAREEKAATLIACQKEEEGKAGGSSDDPAPSSQPSVKKARKTPSNWLSNHLKNKWKEVELYGWPPGKDDMEDLYSRFPHTFTKEANWPLPPEDFDGVVEVIIMGKCPAVTSVTNKNKEDGFHVKGQRHKDVLFFPEGDENKFTPFNKRTVPTWDAEMWVRYLKQWFFIRALYEAAEGGSAGATRG